MKYLDKVHPADLANAISEYAFYDGLNYYIAANTFAKNSDALRQRFSP
jgi:hypothetical protein